MSSLKKEYTGHAGGIPGLVRVTIGTDSRARKVEIDDLVFKETDKQLISDLFVAALNDAFNQLDSDLRKEMTNRIKDAIRSYGDQDNQMPVYQLDDLPFPNGDGSKQN